MRVVMMETAAEATATMRSTAPSLSDLEDAVRAAEAAGSKQQMR